MRSREEALELTLKQVDRMEWEPAKAEEPDMGTELVLYLMEKNAALRSALVRIEQNWGHCGACGTPCKGFTDGCCDRPFWAPDDPAEVAQAALAIAGETRSAETNADLVQPEG